MKVALEVVMKYMKLEWSDTWTAETLKVETAYASASANTNGYAWNVDLTGHLGCMRNVRLVRQADSRRDKRRFAATIQFASVPKGGEFLASVLRIIDNIRA